ncbi:cytochrome c oxidase accessory protein CcoG [Candidatus Thioglobus sp.]|jgi:cytochrome c oxidase accessory protein FixG|uniref:cytochrome c oxidase accessory protein CcoG n=1 Tax=Candidatus Thioglobus sp. TaxID=2026721 RepID=UPI001ED1D178|nr:cytochrome c oxidase accessory protein CcoG [Candidatus Thioglobus sp.]MBT3276963.1 cytochrome c oxidase accessory protein CcoG [Candidatus Thioglobus sp.]MBT4746899.1 cytochrome c oxidase accessory protein CcoG [Candidatus Thioglobus sp.]
MSDNKIQLETLYEEGDLWVQNLGDETIHAKRMGGKFRNFKWLAIIFWTPFFIGPYLTWNDKQAILFDMENRQYHLFDITIFPQDIWMLTMVLLFLAILLAAMTTVLGRVFCGYFCFQTIWTDIFTWVETKVEGAPIKRRKLDKESISFSKIRKKVIKHAIWMSIALFSGITWMLYFGVSWADYFNADITTMTLTITITIASGAYIFAGFMREQTCMWVCPYARIQGAMVDNQSIMPTYDYYRGENRGKLKKGKFVEGNGDCIDCNQCVAVCPTGVDIRKGQEYGCITCGLCIDACDVVMEKVGRPKGLIRYTSLAEMEFKQAPKPLYKRFRVIVYGSILVIALSILAYGMSTLASMDLKVLHDRQPLFVQLSDGSIRNKYELKVMNKTDKDMQVAISFKSPIKGLTSKETLGSVMIPTGNVKSIFVYLSAYENNVGDDYKVTFVVKGVQSTLEYDTSFFTPRSMR